MSNRTKLPKWAQAEFAQLEREIAEAVKEIERFTAGEETRIVVDPLAPWIGRSRVSTYVPNDQSVRFYPTSQRRSFYVDVSLGRRGDDIAVEVMTSLPLSIELMASNRLQIFESDQT